MDRSSEPHILAAIQLFTCQRELHAAQWAKCRVGHGNEIADPVNTLVDKVFDVDNLFLASSKRSRAAVHNSLFDMNLHLVPHTYDRRDHKIRTMPDQ